MGSKTWPFSKSTGARPLTGSPGAGVAGTSSTQNYYQNHSADRLPEHARGISVPILSGTHRQGARFRERKRSRGASGRKGGEVVAGVLGESPQNPEPKQRQESRAR